MHSLTILPPMRLKFGLLVWEALSLLSGAVCKVYHAKDITEAQFTALGQPFVSANRVLCMRECNAREDCVAWTFDSSSTRCSIGSVDLSATGGAALRVWMDLCES